MPSERTSWTTGSPMSERLLSEMARQIHDLRLVVLLVVLAGLATAVAGCVGLVRRGRMDNVLQATLALSDATVPAQFVLAFLVVRFCLVVSALWTHEVAVPFLPVALAVGSVAAGIVARDARGAVRGVVIEAVAFLLVIVHAMVSGYLALAQGGAVLMPIAFAVAIVTLLVAVVAFLSDVRTVLDGPALDTPGRDE